MRSFIAAMLAAVALMACGPDPLKPTVDFSGANAGGKKPVAPSKQLYVDLSVAENGNGDKEQPFQNIQSAVNAASDDTEIRIAAGQYNESIILKAGVSLKGGFSPDDWGVNNPTTYSTVISDSSGKGGPNLDQPKAAISIIASHKPLLISNLTIQGPSVDADSSSSATYNESSAGIFVKDSSAVFIDNVKINGGNTGKYTSGVMFLGSKGEVTGAQVFGGKGLTSYGLYVSGETTMFANNNRFEAMGSVSSIALFSSSMQGLQIRGNTFKGGSGGTDCYGIFQYAPMSGVSLIANNVVTGAACATKNIGIELRGDNARKGQFHVRNNTVAPVTNGNTAFAAPISITTISEALIEITNNMLLDYGENLDSACIYENDVNSTPYLVRNNNLHGCNNLYHRFHGAGVYLNTITAIQNETGFDASHNKALNPQLDAAFKFSGTPNAELTHGGVDGKLEDWTFVDDRDGLVRTDDKNGIGWTIGAYEFN